MKKEYFKVCLRDKDNVLVALCQSIAVVRTTSFGKAYIFRDLITGKTIIPSYDESLNDYALSFITYDNYDKNTYHKIPAYTALSILKALTPNQIEEYQAFLNDIETQSEVKMLVRN